MSWAIYDPVSPLTNRYFRINSAKKSQDTPVISNRLSSSNQGEICGTKKRRGTGGVRNTGLSTPLLHETDEVHATGDEPHVAERLGVVAQEGAVMGIELFGQQA
jgi:hypothetical protein